MREARCESIGQHKHGIRFVDDDGRCLACSVEVLRRERDEARETAQRLNRRTQEAEAALADLRKCVEAVNGGKPWCGGSLGRAVLAWDNTQLRDRIAALEARNAALVEAVSPLALLAGGGVNMNDPLCKWFTVAQLQEAKAALARAEAAVKEASHPP